MRCKRKWKEGKKSGEEGEVEGEKRVEGRGR